MSSKSCASSFSSSPKESSDTCEYCKSFESFSNLRSAQVSQDSQSNQTDYQSVCKSCLDNSLENNLGNSSLDTKNQVNESLCDRQYGRSTRLQSKTVKRIGVFYSDLCDVVKSMRSFSSQSNNSSFKSDKPDKENLLDYSNERASSLNGASTKVAKTMVKTPLAHQRQPRRNSEPPNQQPNGLTQQQQQTQQPQQYSKPNATLAKLKMTGDQQGYFADDKTKMNEQLITKDKQSLLNKVSSSEQNLFKPFNSGQLLLQVPATENNFDQSSANPINGSSSGNVPADEVDAFRLGSHQQSYNVSGISATNVPVNGQVNATSLTNSLTQNHNRQTATSNLPDLLPSSAHVHPPPAYSAYQPPGLLPFVEQCQPIGTLSLRQMARLQHQSIPINSLPANLTSPLSLNIARSRNSTAALLSSAPLSPSNLLNARVHQPLSADNYRNTLGNSSLSSVPNSTNTSLPSTVPLSTVAAPSVVPPHVHHHQLRFPLGPLNGRRFTSSGFLGADLDAITQSKSCLGCTSMGLRWGILLIAFIGLLSAIVGTCLFAVRPSGRDNFTLAIILLGKSRFGYQPIVCFLCFFFYQ